MSDLNFSFGENWESYSRAALSEPKVKQARENFKELYHGIELLGASFLDVGFGQGLSLCLAQEFGAHVLGLDVDARNSVALERTVEFLHCNPKPEAVIGSILDRAVVAQLNSRGPFNIVHAWGSLHHTGDMWRAIANCCMLVSPGGVLMVAIYKTHWTSPIWKAIKWAYNKGGCRIKRLLLAGLYWPLFFATLIITRKHPKHSRRGMDFDHDVVDWIGGYPYEYAAEKEIKDFICKLGFSHLRTYPAKVPTGNNEMLFVRSKN